MKFDDMIHDALTNGGGTYVTTSGYFGLEKRFYFFKPEVETGFYVSEPRGIENLPYLDSNVVKQFLGRHSEAEYLGLWKDEFGNWSVDVSTWVPEAASAVARGIDNNQRAIWDISRNVAFTLPTRQLYATA